MPSLCTVLQFFLMYLLFLDAMFLSDSSARRAVSFLLSFGVNSGVINTFLILSGLFSFTSLVQFLMIASLSCLFPVCTTNSPGRVHFLPNLTARVIFTVNPRYCWKIEVTLSVPCCFLSWPSSDVDSGRLWTITLRRFLFVLIFSHVGVHCFNNAVLG